VDGVEKPLLGGRDRDEVVATEIVYSDSLLSLLLRAARPEFRDGGGDVGKYNQDGGGVVIIPASPTSPEDWEKQHGEAANPK